MNQEGHPWMVDVSGKARTERTATAEGWVFMPPQVCQAVAEGRNAKGNVLQVAEVAGIEAIKKTSGLIPLCHPLILHHGSVVCRVEPSKGVHITCTVKAGEVTGVEMEALTGVSVAALTIYDMCKALDKGMEIGDIRLLKKEGGKSGSWERGALSEEEGKKSRHVHRIPGEITVGVLTVSDKGSVGERVDTSGPALVALAEEQGFTVREQALVPDEKESIGAMVCSWIDEKKIDLVLLTGGTGLSLRDVTPEAVLQVADREIPGFGERMRSYSLNFTERGILSRGLGACRGNALILTLPGSQKGATQCFQGVAPVIPHALAMLRGKGH